MASSAEFDSVVNLRPFPEGGEQLPGQGGDPQAPEVQVVPEPALGSGALPVGSAVVQSEAKERPRAAHPRWIVPAAIAAAGIIAAGSLTYFLVGTTGQRDAARSELASTKVTLASTKTQLATADTQAATNKVVADYVSVYVANSGRVQTDYEQIAACDAYSACRTAAQQLLTDLQAFQAARNAATVPGTLSNSDGMLGDSISAGIAASQEFITGMDNNDATKITDGLTKLDAGMLAMAKAETALGAAIQ